MLEHYRTRPALIADPDSAFLGSLKSDPVASKIPPLLAKNGKEAQLLIADTKIQLSGVFVNPTLSDPNGLSVIRCTHMHRPATPIFVIHDGPPPFTKEALEHLAVQEAIPKPLNYTQVLKFVTPAAVLFDSDASLELSKKFQDKIDSELTIEDAEFVPIRAEDFLSGSKSFFDLYVRLSSGRYIKILQSGDTFSSERVSSYLKKGVTQFFLRKEAQEHYLAFCDKLATNIVDNKNAPTELKVSQTLNHGEETMNFFKKNGLSETNMQYAVNFLSNVEKLTKNIVASQSDHVKGFLEDIASYEHGVGTAMIASLLITPLKIMASNPVKVIGIGSMLHDIGLYKMDPALRDEDESIMTPEQLAMYHTHPTVGAEILKSVRGIEPVVIQAIAQHHERRNKKGFPQRLGAGAINRVAEIIGISDELVKLIHKSKTDPAINPIRDMELTILEGFSNPVVEAYRTVFAANL